MGRGAWRATVHGATKSWTWLSNLTITAVNLTEWSHFTFICFLSIWLEIQMNLQIYEANYGILSLCYEAHAFATDYYIFRVLFQWHCPGNAGIVVKRTGYEARYSWILILVLPLTMGHRAIHPMLLSLSLLNCEMEVSIKNEWNYLHKGPAVLNKQQLILQLDWWDFPCLKHNAGGFTELFYSIYEVGILFIDEETEIQRS